MQRCGMGHGAPDRACQAVGSGRPQHGKGLVRLVAQRRRAGCQRDAVDATLLEALESAVK